MKFRSGQEYSLQVIAKSASWDQGAEIFEHIDMLTGKERIVYLTEKINQVCAGDQLQSVVFGKGTKYEDVVYSSLESLLAMMLMARGRSYGEEFERTKDLADLCKCFLDLDYATHFSLAPETLGLCCYYRMYFFPKGTGLVDLQNKFLSNEYNIVRLTLDQDCRFVKNIQLNFSFPDFSPSVLYMLLTLDGDNKELFFEAQKVSDLSGFIPFTNAAPNFHSALQLRLEKVLKSDEYSQLVGYRYEPAMLNLRVVTTQGSGERQ